MSRIVPCLAIRVEDTIPKEVLKVRSGGKLDKGKNSRQIVRSSPYGKWVL